MQALSQTHLTRLSYLKPVSKATFPDFFLDCPDPGEGWTSEVATYSCLKSMSPVSSDGQTASTGAQVESWIHS
ncbi:uncharacterized protein HMPREF1541_10909 [Cyphellophora europaea CBS 101466]|uniref:Uncharacterized protein n=1 Tax=Cyphellophora europaea (strain CBS 101466) TaxID=1220924 RepID=W2S7Z6_CYPE1|nr:uncharacterized protein HMPREF1541_10909 [Cyphellophora europaea CBS 101466]ETN44044.1 hypothetical protein HMPREF1541_10909 [Cyphellophora europaea CBS 101466]